MSIWTHINCSIRLNAIRALGEILPPNVMHFPLGSEGSLDYSIWENPDLCGLAAYTLSIFGDLRDYNNDIELCKWFKKLITHEYPRWRSAIMEIDNESSDFLLLLIGQRCGRKVSINSKKFKKIRPDE